MILIIAINYGPVMKINISKTLLMLMPVTTCAGAIAEPLKERGAARLEEVIASLGLDKAIGIRGLLTSNGMSFGCFSLARFFRGNLE